LPCITSRRENKSRQCRSHLANSRVRCVAITGKSYIGNYDVGVFWNGMIFIRSFVKIDNLLRAEVVDTVP